MIRRFARIKREFGTAALLRTILLVAGLTSMSAVGLFVIESFWPLLISIIGLILGWVLKKQIVEMIEWVWWALPTALFIYGILLFVGDRSGLSGEAQLVIITVTTVVIFDLQFWSLSDRSIVRADDDQ